MKINDIDIGMKVVPISKSIGIDKSESIEFKCGKDVFLYVTLITTDEICCSRYKYHIGDLFLAKDLIPYIEPIVMPTPTIDKYYLVTDYVENYNNKDGFIGKCISEGGWFEVGKQKRKYQYWRRYANCELKVGKKYYVSDNSVDEAQQFKASKNKYALQECIHVTHKFFKYDDDIQTFKYWVEADEECACTIPGVTTPLVPGKAYWVSQCSEETAVKEKNFEYMFVQLLVNIISLEIAMNLYTQLGILITTSGHML